MEEDGFQLVKRNKRKHGNSAGKNFLKRCHKNGLDEFLALKSTINIGSIRITTLPELMEQIAKCSADLREQGYLDQLKNSIARCLRLSAGNAADLVLFEEIVCFGLGSFAESITSLYQLALLVCMRTELKYCSRVLLYDPCFTPFEREALQSSSIDFHLLSSNTECRYASVSSAANRPSLFFMPHMYAVHYDNLLQSNWHQLSKVVLYCNSFEHLLSTDSVHEFVYLHKLNNDPPQYELTECVVQNRFTFNDIFNNLSIHTFIDRASR